MSPSPFGLSGLSFLFRLVLPPSSDGCAGHSGFLSLFWLVSPPSSGGCVVSFLPLMRSAMSFCFWICCWPPLRHWFGLGALGRVRPLTCRRMSFSELVTARDVSFPSRETHCWHPIRAFFWSASRRSTWGLADLPALVTDPDTWQELSQDSLLASSGSFRPWASGFLSLSWPITLSCATGATATMLTYWLWRQDQTLGRNSSSASSFDGYFTDARLGIVPAFFSLSPVCFRWPFPSAGQSLPAFGESPCSSGAERDPS